MGVRIPLFSEITNLQTFSNKLHLLFVLSKVPSNWAYFLRKYYATQLNNLQCKPTQTQHVGLRSIKRFNYTKNVAKQAFTPFVTLTSPLLTTLHRAYKPNPFPVALHSPANSFYTNLTSALHRWQLGLNLIYQLFFYESRGMFFLHPTLTKESLFLNWESLNCSLLFFKQFTQLFWKLNTSLNFKSSDVFKNNLSLGAEFAIIGDQQYHKANQALLEQSGIYLIHLQSQDKNLRTSNFTLLNLNNSLLTQYFFVKCCFWLKKTALNKKILC